MVDKTQFLELLKPHSKALSAYCLSISNSREDAKDLMSETILTALEKYQKLKDPSKFKSYLFSIARKKNSNLFKKIKEVLMDSISENTLSYENRVSEYDVNYLYTQLSKLQNKYKESFILYEINGFSIKEISEIQKTSETNVKSRLKRGREKLKELYKEEYDKIIKELVSKDVNLKQLGIDSAVLSNRIDFEDSNGNKKFKTVTIQRNSNIKLDSNLEWSSTSKNINRAIRKSVELMVEYDQQMKDSNNPDDLIIKNIDLSDSNGSLKIGQIFLNRDTHSNALIDERAKYEVDYSFETLIDTVNKDHIEIKFNNHLDALSDVEIVTSSINNIDINQLIPVALSFGDGVDYVLWFEASLDLLEKLPNTISNDLYSEILALSQESIPTCGDALVKNPFSTTWETCSGSLENVEVYPNPVNDIANVKFDLIEGRDIHYTITDLNGKEFITFPANKFTSGKNNLQVDMSTLSPGIYYLKINTDQNERIIKRVIKK